MKLVILTFVLFISLACWSNDKIIIHEKQQTIKRINLFPIFPLV